MKHKKVKKIIIFLICIAVFAIISAIIMLLWNNIIPQTIGWNTINYWQSLGLLIMVRLLLGGIGQLKNLSFLMGNFHHLENKNPIIKDIHEKIDNMTPAERRDFIRMRMSNIDKEFSSYCKEKEENKENDTIS